MSGLVEDLLAAARRAAPAFVETDVDLADVVSDATDEYELLAAGGDLRLDRRSGSGATVIGDAVALRRAVDSLLSNALRGAPPGGVVTVASGRMQGWAFAAVRDEGAGIAPEQQLLVFDRFWRGADGRTGNEDRRTGPGLAIVRRIVESTGARWVAQRARRRLDLRVVAADDLRPRPGPALPRPPTRSR